MLLPSFRTWRGRRGEHQLGQGSRSRDDANHRRRSWLDDRSNRPTWRWWS